MSVFASFAWSDHTRSSPLAAALALAFLLVALAPTKGRGQDAAVPLTPKKDGVTLPAQTQVLVVPNGTGRAQSLTDLGIDRDSLSTHLQDAARSDPDALLDTLVASEQTNGTEATKIETSGTYEKGVIHYVLAQTPDRTLYESHMNKGAGFDQVESGTMVMKPVPTDAQDAMQKAFDDALEIATTTTLTLQDAEVPSGTDVRVWSAPGKDATDLGARQPWTSEGRADTLDSEGQTTQRFDRTWHSGDVLYVAARTPEGELYESHTPDGKAGFDVIDQGTITMEEVPQGKRRAALQNVFVPPSPPSSLALVKTKLSGPTGWLVFGLLGLIVGLSASWWWRGREVKDLSRHLKKAKHHERKWRKKVENHQKKPTGRHDLDLRQKNKDLRSEVQELTGQIEAMKRQGARMKDAMQSPSPSHASQHTKKQEPKPPPPKNPERDQVGATFTEWCKNQSPVMVSKYKLFSEHHLKGELPRATFRRITRENNAAGLVFDDDAQDPVEYWLVEAGGQYFLLPQPSRGRFRELHDACFDGSNKVPSAVETVEPAVLKNQNGRLTLAEKGVIR